MGRFRGEQLERQVDFRHQLGTYLRLYAFLSQVVSFQDPDLEKLYAFGRLLITKLRIEGDGCNPVLLDDEVRLAYYRLSKTYEGCVALEPGDAAPVSGPTEVGTGRLKDPDRIKLSQIVDVLNERFGMNLGPADQLLFDQVIGDMSGDAELGDQARSNPEDQFQLVFDPKALDALVARMERNEVIANTFVTNEEFRAAVLDLMMGEVYERFQADGGAEEAAIEVTTGETERG